MTRPLLAAAVLTVFRLVPSPMCVNVLRVLSVVWSESYMRFYISFLEQVDSKGRCRSRRDVARQFDATHTVNRFDTPIICNDLDRSRTIVYITIICNDLDRSRTIICNDLDRIYIYITTPD